MSIQDRAHDIRARLAADMQKTIDQHSIDGVARNGLLEDLVSDATHQVDLLLIEISGYQERDQTATVLPPAPAKADDPYEVITGIICTHCLASITGRMQKRGDQVVWSHDHGDEFEMHAAVPA